MSIRTLDVEQEFRQRTSFLSLPTDCASDSEAKRLLWEQLGPTDRALLGTDGTFTALLAALRGEPIGIVALAQSLDVSTRWDNWLRLDAGNPVLSRTVLMRGRTTGAAIAYARSLIAVARLDDSMRKDLEDGDKPIGLLLRHGATESFRELLDWGSCDITHPARSYLSESQLLFRTYRIIVRHQPIMVVSEHFPTSFGTSGPPRPSTSDGTAPQRPNPPERTDEGADRW
jgi:chorismate-pyruvate lyase